MGPLAMKVPTRFTIEVEPEADGRWIAEIAALPGVLAYGSTREEAVAKAKALALRVLAERLERGEPAGELEGLFEAA
jgi:predicted RNase H-like HicB family nuclease